MKKADLAGWAAIAEIIGTIAVVASLAFVGISVQQNTAAVQAENDNVLYELTDAWWKEFIDKPELDLAYRKILRGESLTEIEMLMTEVHTTRLLNNWEQAYARFHEGLLPPRQWDMYERAIPTLIPYYVPLEFWNMGKQGFAVDFANYLDTKFTTD